MVAAVVRVEAAVAREGEAVAMGLVGVGLVAASVAVEVAETAVESRAGEAVAKALAVVAMAAATMAAVVAAAKGEVPQRRPQSLLLEQRCSPA